jgi:hypothetical protein
MLLTTVTISENCPQRHRVLLISNRFLKESYFSTWPLELPFVICLFISSTMWQNLKEVRRLLLYFQQLIEHPEWFCCWRIVRTNEWIRPTISPILSQIIDFSLLMHKDWMCKIVTSYYRMLKLKLQNSPQILKCFHVLSIKNLSFFYLLRAKGSILKSIIIIEVWWSLFFFSRWSPPTQLGRKKREFFS